MSTTERISQNMFEDVKSVVVKTLGLDDDRAATLHQDTGLLGNLPEFDSFAVVEVMTALEERFGFTIDDEDVTAEIFETFGDLTDFVKSKLA